VSKPLAIDLFCGLGGWTEGLLAEGYYVVGFDIERHQYAMPESVTEPDGLKGTKPVAKRGWTQGCAISLGMEGANSQPRTHLAEYPAQLVLQDVLTLHGSQFKDAALIVASPPCQEFSYMAMPWSRAKAIAADYRAGVRDVKKLTALFDACFRIQREAIEAAGHFIPLVVENVRGAIPWVGRSRWNYGSYHLWGDVPALMPMTRKVIKNPDCKTWYPPSDPRHKPNQRFNRLEGQKVPGFRFDGSGIEGMKTVGHVNQRDGYTHTRRLTNQAESDAVKNGGDWFDSGADCSSQRRAGSKSTARKAASAQIARIPFALARHIARTYLPT
jgi:hypothetical protein